MRKSFLVLLPCLALAIVGADVHAQTAPADAGELAAAATDAPASPTVTSVGSGTSPDRTVTGSDMTPTVDPTAIPDPSKDPLGFVSALRAAWSKSWGVGVGLAVWGLLELLAFAGTKKDIAWLAWLGKGRISIVIGGLAGLMPTFIAALTGAAAWTAFFAVLVPAVAAWWHPAGTDPKKDINPVTTNPPPVGIPTARTVSR